LIRCTSTHLPPPLEARLAPRQKQSAHEPVLVEMAAVACERCRPSECPPSAITL